MLAASAVASEPEAPLAALLGLYAGNYACTYSGVVNGTNTVLGTVAVTLTADVLTGVGTPTYPAGVQQRRSTSTAR